MKNIEFKVTSSSCCTPRVPSNTKETVKEEHASYNGNLPVAIIGAGPIGLAAAAHLAERGQNFILLRPDPALLKTSFNGGTYDYSRHGSTISIKPPSVF